MTAAWHSAHVRYYALDKDALILDGIRPLLHDLQPVVDRAYLARHWRQGPHLRVNVRTEPAVWHETVRPRIERHLGAYLAEHPSTSAMDEAAELPVHRRLAQLELETGPLTPWFPDNSVQFPPYDARVAVLGNEDVAELVADFSAAGTELLIAMLDHARTGAATKELLAIDLMLAASHTVAPPLQHAFISYRSHAEGFLFASGDPAGTRARFDAHYREHRAVLTERVRRVVATLDGRTDAAPVPFVREWAQICRHHVRRAAPLADAGRLFPPTPAPAAGDPQRSTFHALMLGSPRYRAEIFDAAWFHLYRLALNNTYLQINRLGLAPHERLRACHIAANAVEDVYGVSAHDLVSGFVRHSGKGISATLADTAS